MGEDLFEFFVIGAPLEDLEIVGVLLGRVLVTKVLIACGVDEVVGPEDQGILELHVLIDLLVEEVFVFVFIVESEDVEVEEGNVSFVGDFLGDFLDYFLELLLAWFEGFLEGDVAHVEPQVGLDHVCLHVIEELLFHLFD